MPPERIVAWAFALLIFLVVLWFLVQLLNRA